MEVLSCTLLNISSLVMVTNFYFLLIRLNVICLSRSVLSQLCLTFSQTIYTLIPYTSKPMTSVIDVTSFCDLEKLFLQKGSDKKNSSIILESNQPHLCFDSCIMSIASFTHLASQSSTIWIRAWMVTYKCAGEIIQPFKLCLSSQLQRLIFTDFT